MSNMPDCGVTAGASGEPDPIFAAIERHRAAFRIWRAAYDRLRALHDRWEIFNEMPPHYTDAPEWIEANTAFLPAVEELDKALEAVLSTPPTTISGVADLLDYVGRYECHPVVNTTNYEPVLECYLAFRNAPNNFLPMIAASLPQRATGEPDPIFAAIERHRAAVRGWLAAIDRRGALRQIIPEARRRWEFDERPDRCTDAPEWIAVNTAFLAAVEELDKALEAVLSTAPTTISGVADLLDYVGREEWEVASAVEWEHLDGTILEIALEGVRDQGLVENVERVRKAAVNFLPMIAATLRSLTAESS